MRSWSIPVGRLFGIEIRVHLTFLFLLVFLFSTEVATQDASAALRVLGLFSIVFGSVVLHELGHALVARGSGVPAKGIILLPIGGITILDEAHAIPDPINAWRRDVRIAAAGPLVNLFIAGLSALVLLAVIPGFSLTARPLLHSSALLRSIVWANLYLGLFNLLPADADGNAWVGSHIEIDTHNTTVFGEKRLVATIGLQGLVIVDTEDALLVCTKEREQEVREIVRLLKESGRSQWL